MSKNKTSAKLFPEAFAVDLHVLEDDYMIQSLERDKFVELCIHGSQGWQQGVSTPHNFSNFVALGCFYHYMCCHNVSVVNSIHVRIYTK
jgi:hypothetical protein